MTPQQCDVTHRTCAGTAGVLRWTVPAGSVGNVYRFRLSASDLVSGNTPAAQEFTVTVVDAPANSPPRFDFAPLRTATATMRYVIRVIPDNDSPVLAPIPNLEVTSGNSLIYELSATDPDGNPITFTLSGWPGAAVDNDLARITFSGAGLAPGTVYNATAIAIDSLDAASNEKVPATKVDEDGWLR